MLNPYLLWFLPLVAVPVLLHLLSLRRLKTVEFSAFRFLMDGYVQQRRRVRLLEFLLAFLRTLFVLLIVLTLSRPIVERFGFLFRAGGGRDVIVVLDSGSSMALREGSTSSFERGRAAAKAVVELLGPEDYVTVIQAGQKPRVVEQRFVNTPKPILASIDRLEPEAATAALGESLGSALRRRRRGARILCVITDGNRKAWADVSAAALAEPLREEDRIMVMNVGRSDAVENLAVIGNPPPPLDAVVGLPVRLTATIANSEARETADTVLRVIVDGKQVSQSSLSVRPGGRETRTIHFTPSRAGVLEGRFELPADAFTQDDSFLFALNVQPRLNVALVADAGDGNDEYGPGVYLRAALESPLHAGDGLSEMDRRIAATLSITTLAPTNVQAKTLQPMDAVVVADVALAPASLQDLRRYVEQGGGLIFFPGPSIDTRAINRTLLGTNAVPGGPAPLMFGPAEGDVNDESTFEPVGGLRLAHPVLSVFDSEERDFFRTVRIFRRFSLRPGDTPDGDPLGIAQGTDHTASPVTVLIRLPDNSPLLVEMSIGRGRALVAGVPATPEWSNLPLKPEFVPLLLRGLVHVRRPSIAALTPDVRPRRPAVLRLSEEWKGASAQAIGPDGRFHTIDLHRSGPVFVGAMSETGQKGYYRFHVVPADGAGGESLERGFAVNLDTVDADILRQDRAGITAALSPLPVLYMEGEPNDPLLVEQLTEKQEIWRALIWVTFTVMGIEFFLSTLRQRRERERKGMSGRARRWLAEFDGLGVSAPSPGTVTGDET